MKNTTLAILGAGSWGTAVAIHLAQGGQRVLLWGRNPEHVKNMTQSRENQRYLPGIKFPESLIPEPSLEACTQQADELIIAVPSHAFADLLPKLPQKLAGLAWLTKGIDPKTHACLSQLITARWGNTFPMAAISGPSFAKEVANGLPTALVIAGNESQYLHKLRDMLHHGNLRVYLSHDLIGVQCAGAVKNVLAIACGISDGLNYGANAKAALITRGLAEMGRLGMALGASPDTFMGLAGLGDLVLTCTDNQSRNRRFGLLLGQGQEIIDAEQSIGQVVEGKYNAAQVCALAKNYALDLPICQAVDGLLQEHTTAEQAAQSLLARPPRNEEAWWSP
ncbi:MAG: NAD(P)-dependent glycerol-3-phosphate dehydrogenase [Legionellaceae bacterium]|nr:NAD(P)-dependent glycerol-3-phosphate dehydrogenase [Legionellaceae bacterium]